MLIGNLPVVHMNHYLSKDEFVGTPCCLEIVVVASLSELYSTHNVPTNPLIHSDRLRITRSYVQNLGWVLAARYTS